MTTRFPESNYHRCTLDDIGGYIEAIDPVAYDKTRNSLDGAVTWLSPFLSHGIIDTVDVATRLLKRHKPQTCYRMLFELGWREYFHRVWQLHSDNIFHDMRKPQVRVDSEALPRACADANTDIQSVDEALRQAACNGADVVRQEYSACQEWPGTVESRQWLYSMPDGDFNSFSEYFKLVKQEVGL